MSAASSCLGEVCAAGLIEQSLAARPVSGVGLPEAPIEGGGTRFRAPAAPLLRTAPTPAETPPGYAAPRHKAKVRHRRRKHLRETAYTFEACSAPVDSSASQTTSQAPLYAENTYLPLTPAQRQPGMLSSRSARRRSSNVVHNQEQFPGLPPGYRVDETEDLLALRRPDGSVVAYFSALGTMRRR